MDNPQEIKKVILAALVEKGDYKSVLKHLSAEEKTGKETEKAEKLTKLISPISAFADLLTENSKGAFMEDLEARLDDTTAKGLTELSEAIEEAKTTLQDELRSVLDASKAEMIEEHLARYSAAEGMLTEKLMAQAIETAAAKAEELLPSLKEGARLTEDEINDIIDAAALSVESQVTDIIGDYIDEYGISVAQITGFTEAVRALLPADRQVTWNEIVGKPEISQGGTNVNLVRQLITEALAANPSSSTFLDLTDTPSAYTGQAGKVVAVNGTEDGLEFISATGVGTVTSVAVSGSDGIEVDSGSPITAAGTIALGLNKATTLTFLNVADGAQVNAIDSVTDTSEIDLAITAKALSATIVAGSIDETKLDASVNASLDLADTASQPGHTHVAADVTDFDTEVSNNTDVAANTAARHTAVTVTDSAEIDFTLTGQNITASLIAGSIDETKLDASVNASLDKADSASQPGHTHIAADITDFDTEVSNNTDVAANTTARHAAVTVTDSSEINFTLTGQDITASLVASSIDETKLDASVNASLDLADTALQAADVDDTPVNGATTDPISSNWAFDHAATAASDTAAGHVELAIASEVTTGTDAARAVTPDALAGSEFGKRTIAIQVSGSASADTALATGDGLAVVPIDTTLNGMNLVAVKAYVSTVSSSGAPLFQVRRSRRSSATARTIVDMLSTGVSIDASEFESADAATGPTINTSNDDVQTGDTLLIDCDTAGTGTKGAMLLLTFQLA